MSPEPPVAPDDTPTRLLDERVTCWINGEAQPAERDTAHLLLDLVERLKVAEAALQAADARHDDLGRWLDEARADVSRLQQENALLRRSLEMLTKQLDEKDERIDELTGLIGEVD